MPGETNGSYRHTDQHLDPDSTLASSCAAAAPPTSSHTPREGRDGNTAAAETEGKPGPGQQLMSAPRQGARQHTKFGSRRADADGPFSERRLVPAPLLEREGDAVFNFHSGFLGGREDESRLSRHDQIHLTCDF